MIGPKPPKREDDAFDEVCAISLWNPSQENGHTGHKRQRSQEEPPPLIAVKQEVSDAVHYDLLSGDTALRYFYLGLVAGSRGDMTFHALALPFLHRLLQRYQTDSITIKCTLIDTRVRWILDDDHMDDTLAEVGWTTQFDPATMTHLFDKGTKSKRLFLAFFFGWVATLDTYIDLRSTDIEPLQTIQTLLNSFGFTSNLRLATMPATALENPTAQFQLQLPLEENNALLQQGLDVLEDERIPLDPHAQQLKMGSNVCKVVSDKSDLHRQVARDFDGQPWVVVNAMLDLVDMRDLDIDAFITAIQTMPSTDLLHRYLLCYDPDTKTNECICKDCGKVFCSKNARKVLSGHIRLVHSHQKFPCLMKKCQRIFGSKKARSLHIQSFHEKKKVVCPEKDCDKVCSLMGGLSRHLRTVHQKIRFPCTFEGCQKDFSAKSTVAQHIRVFHEKQRIPCPVEGCNVMFTGKSSKATHLRSVHGNEKFACTYDGCDLVFTQKPNMMRHVKVFHEKKTVACVFIGCEKTFKDRSYMTEHVKVAHENRRFKCSFAGCQTVTHGKYAMKRHIKAIHENQKIVCTFDGCAMAFVHKDSMLQHIRSYHEGIKFACTFDGCAKTFVYKDSMRQHVRTYHEGIKFACTFEGCECVFTQKSAMMKHIKSVHENQKQQVPCAFDGCDMIFTLDRSMKAHFKRFHVK